MDREDVWPTPGQQEYPGRQVWDTPGETDTAGDIHTPLDTDTHAEIQADTPAPDNVVADTMSGPESRMDPYVTMRPQHHQL